MTQLIIGACLLTGIALAHLVGRRLESHAETFLVTLVLVGGFAGFGSRYAAMHEQTRYWRSLGLTEAGTSSLEVGPPVPLELVHTARDVLRPGDSWALVTDRGSCREFPYGFFWTAFHLIPNLADCEDPDVRLLLRVPPGDDANVVAEGDRFWLTRP